ncbi:MAG: helix-turn-helix transcriptional regulator [Planctomycetaceae bacterium]|nr:helix-turn-helix transcriptional regulator [Planctomycetaceae bacterium]
MSQKQNKTLSDQLRELIDDAGISRYRLSQQTGISQSLLSRFMHGTAFFSEASLNTLADALGVELVKKKTSPKRK